MNDASAANAPAEVAKSWRIPETFCKYLNLSDICETNVSFRLRVESRTERKLLMEDSQQRPQGPRTPKPNNAAQSYVVVAVCQKSSWPTSNSYSFSSRRTIRPVGREVPYMNIIFQTILFRHPTVPSGIVQELVN